QSFIGLIRGPLEFAQLITTRESESGNYRRNEYWLSKFAGLDAQANDRLSEVFDRFAAKFDDLLIAAKDASFQIRSSEKPSGLLSIELNAPLFLLMRSLANIDRELSYFISAAVA